MVVISVEDILLMGETKEGNMSLKAKIEKIIDAVYFNGAEAGGIEYGTEAWSSSSDADLILTAFRSSLPKEKKVIIDGSHFYASGFNDCLSAIAKQLKEV